MAESGLAEPTDLDALRNLPNAHPLSLLHRLSEYSTPWWFSSSDIDVATGGRFDLPAPDGSCYTAESLDGALVEKLLRTSSKVVPAERFGELFHTVITVRRSPHLADFAAPGATGFGLNHEVHTTLDYHVTRRGAAAVRRAGWRGLRYLLRGDPSGSTAGSALFGKAGLHRRAPAGLRARVQQLDRNEADRLLAARNVEVRPIPADVPVIAPHEEPRR